MINAVSNKVEAQPEVILLSDAQQAFLEQLNAQKIVAVQQAEKANIAFNAAMLAILRGSYNPDAPEYRGWVLTLDKSTLTFGPPPQG